MAKNEWADPLLKEDTQKEQNVFFDERARTEPGTHQGVHLPVNQDPDLPTEEPVGESRAEYEGRQSGTNRGEHVAGTVRGGNTNAEQLQQAAFAGDVSTRAPEGAKQGISNASSDADAEGQRKVVAERPDARAGENQFKR